MNLKVHSVMTTDIKSIPSDMNAKEALSELVRSGSSGLLVTEKNGSLAGVFTEREVLQLALPVYVKDIGTFVYSRDPRHQLKRLINLEKFTVKELMRKEVPVVSEETSILEVSKLMLTKSERRVVVIKDNKPIGVITRCDIIRALAKEAGVVKDA